MTAVLSHVDPLIEHLSVDGETLETTPQHPFYTEEVGWETAGSLQPGEHIFRAGGGWGAVNWLSTEQRPELMYNLTVETAHTFFVGDEQLLVHNDCEHGKPYYELSDHVQEQMEKRNISERDIERALSDGRKYFDNNHGTDTFVIDRYFPNGDSLRVAQNPDTFNITTVIRDHEPFNPDPERYGGAP